jgi:hypothetical protein
MADIDTLSFVTLAASGMQPECLPPDSAQDSGSPDVSGTSVSRRSSQPFILNLANDI